MLRILTIGVLIAALGTAFLSFDTAVSGEYLRHRVAWERDGRPNGFLWRCGHAGWARGRCAWSWLFHTPSWARADLSAAGALKTMRATALVWNVGCPVWFWFFVVRPKSGRAGRGEAPRGALAR